MQTAPLLRRYLAYAFDSVICFFFIHHFQASVYDVKTVQVFGFILVFGYFFLEGTLQKGQSLGKRIFKIRYVSVVSETIRPWQAAVRALFVALTFSPPIPLDGFEKSWMVIYTLIIIFLWIAIFAYPLFHPQRRSVLDILTKTWMVRSESSAIGDKPILVGLNLKSNLVSAIIMAAFLLPVYLSQKFTTELALLSSLSTKLTEENDRNTHVQITTVTRNGESTTIIVAGVQVKPEEVADKPTSEATLQKYADKDTKIIEALNQNDAATGIQIIIYSEVRIGYVIPLNFRTSSAIIPLQKKPLPN